MVILAKSKRSIQYLVTNTFVTKWHVLSGNKKRNVKSNFVLVAIIYCSVEFFICHYRLINFITIAC